MVDDDRTHLAIANECVCCGSGDLKKSPAVLMPFVAERALGWSPVEITREWGLRDVPLGYAFSICNTMKCCDCGMLFLDLRFGDRELSSLYADYRGKSYTELRQKYEPGYTARNEVLLSGYDYIPVVEEFLGKHITSAPRILDWGGDSGLNTPLRAVARQHHIYDISDKAVVAGAVKVSILEAERNTYDLIVVSEVLEHVPYPGVTLNLISKVMKHDTLLYIEVPQEELMRTLEASNSLEHHKRHWHEHINFFTKKSLLSLLSASNLQLVEFANLQIWVEDKSTWIYSIICRLKA